jgi:uncharacterized protein YkwD
MKYVIFLVMLVLPIECKKQSPKQIFIEHTYAYSEQEIDLMKITNQYRQSLQLDTLQPIEHIGYLCQKHNLYMIEKDTVTHDYFYDRQVNIQQLLKATQIGEIIACNYEKNQSVLQAWINSPTHAAILRKSIYTNFGVSITTNPTTNRKYYTFIFIKKM